MTLPLDGVRVVELAEGWAGPYAGKLLALLGADVIKVEPRGGERGRHRGAVVPGAGPAHERRAAFLHLNTNKRSLAADPARSEDVSLVRRALERAHVLLEGVAPATVEGYGVDREELSRVNPALNAVSVTPFGKEGPYAGYLGEEIVTFAVAGPMSATGIISREPVKMGADIGQYQSGGVAALAALAALSVSERNGVGVDVDVAQVDTQLVSIDRRMSYLLYRAYTGRDAPRSQGRLRVGPFPSGIKLAEDGNVWISTMPQWVNRMLSVLGDPELEVRYQQPNFMTDLEVAELTDVAVLTWGVARSRQQAMEEAQAHGWPVMAVNAPVDLLADPHFRARGFWHSLEHPEAGSLEYPGPPVRMPGG
ncbi:MAG TPA: CoA transferase, partial [Acidimicrobiales bacterium]|nr:CoA transferase [Acidimicrobiales bacterium]